jgi:type I restriction enzyme S subunit
MAGEWHERLLSAMVDVKHGFAFSGDNIRDEPPGDILLTPGNFAIGGGFKGDKFKYFDGDVPDDYVLNEGDLIVTMTDLSKQTDTLGYPAIVPKAPGARFLHNQRIGKVLLKHGAELDGRFLFYLLRSTAYRREVLASATGTTVKHTSPRRILAHRAALPPLTEQRTIAEVLGALDDKIELNRRMDATLEAMARALFQSWFVDFDPVRAKLDGRTPAFNPSAAALFPSGFQDSPLGHIPSGWETGSILRQADLLSGGTPKTNVPEYWNGDIPWASAKDISQCSGTFLISTERTITKLGVEESSTRIIPALTTVIVARGATTGRLAMLGHAMAMNQTCYGLRSHIGVPFALYCNARHFIERLVQGGHGSIFDTVTTNTFEATSVLLAPTAVLRAFDEEVAPLFHRIHANARESRALATLRDTLLPKLLSGELRVDGSNDTAVSNRSSRKLATA